MKVVINKTFVPLRLSFKGIKSFSKRKTGMDLYFYRKDYTTNKFIKINENNEDKNDCLCIASSKDYGNGTYIINDDDYCIANIKNIKRNDKDLIYTIETLGNQSLADGMRVRIVKIPDNVEFEIYNNNGRESIHEKHRVWE